jgi:hypothetical protein
MHDNIKEVLLNFCFMLNSSLDKSSILKIKAIRWMTFSGLRGVLSEKIERFNIKMCLRDMRWGRGWTAFVSLRVGTSGELL